MQFANLTLYRAMKFRPFIKSWLPVLLWMVFIFISSTDLMSAEHTSRFIGPFLRWFAPAISDASIASVQLFVRKCAHLAEYAILSALLLRALRQHLLAARSVAFALAALYAVLDEIHQSFVPSRTGSPWDVVTDSIGAILGLVIYVRMTRRISNLKSAI
jgi:VanZ family protein